MEPKEFIEKARKNAVVLVGFGIVLGALSLWVLGKIFSPYFSPYIDPYIKAYCRDRLGLSSDNRTLRESQPIKVEATPVEVGTMTRRINTVGLLRANHEVIIRSEIAGKVKEILFREGEAVNQGDILIRFEDADLLAELEEAKSDLLYREGDYKRNLKLKEQGFLSEKAKVYDEARSAFDRAKARVDKAEAQLAKSQLVAPFSGTVGLIKVDVGEYLQPNAEMVKIVDYTPIKVNFKVPEKYFHDLGVGQFAEVRLDGFLNEVFRATIEAIEPSADSQSHSVAATATIPNEDQRLRSGLYANISVIIGEKSNTLMVPETAIHREGATEYVWVVHNGRARIAPVLTGTRENAKVEIIQGLLEGMVVISVAPPHISAGMPVEVINQPSVMDVLKEGIKKGASGQEKKIEEKAVNPQVNQEKKAEKKNTPEVKEGKKDKTLKEPL